MHGGDTNLLEDNNLLVVIDRFTTKDTSTNFDNIASPQSLQPPALTDFLSALPCDTYCCKRHTHVDRKCHKIQRLDQLPSHVNLRSRWEITDCHMTIILSMHPFVSAHPYAITSSSTCESPYPGQRHIYDTLKREFYWLQMDDNGVKFKSKCFCI